jgi:hypothetical protein
VAQSIEQLSYELTAKVLTEQEHALSGLRAGAGTVLGASSIAGSAYRTASSWLDPHVQANRRTVARLSGWLSASCVLLAIEVACWTISVAS